MWVLYDLNTDPAELNDLSTVMPEKFQEMKLLYNDYAERNGVIQVPEGWRMFENLGTSQDQFDLNKKKLILVLFFLLMVGLLAIAFYPFSKMVFQ